MKKKGLTFNKKKQVILFVGQNIQIFYFLISIQIFGNMKI
jgi:hypothetical protein